MMKIKVAALLCLFFILSCERKFNTTFHEVSNESGIAFINQLDYTEELNPYTYRNFYNGGGVAIGDVNNDGLQDIYFTGNLVDNKLFLNKGNFQFEDVTTMAGVACEGSWSTGATFVDVNQDGWLDIYVCKSGPPSGNNRHNELFINQKDGTFIESAKAYGLAIEGLSTHAAFFDYDKDGDLDVYILTNSIRSVGVGHDIVEGRREIPSTDNGGNKFLRNENGKFVDITLEAGIYTSDIGYGLGITLGDFNQDSWTDIFISNDFFERDYLYINNKSGGFQEQAEMYFGSLSMGSMGADGADLDNDGLSEIMVTEMLPATIERKRTKAIYESWDKYSLTNSKGYHHQFPRNMLQRNLGENLFVEIGRLSGVSATEWSWGTLIFDLNNDGLKDIFVSNGIYKDLLDRDYLNYMANAEQIRALIKSEENAITKLIDIMPSVPVQNATFLNKGNLSFSESSEEIGLGGNTFSNGAAYGDLDNDGDLDLVINNVNMPAFVYKNELDQHVSKSLRLKLKATNGNTFGIGAMVEVWSNQEYFNALNYPSKGFQSSVEPIVHLGLGSIDKVDSLKITWPDGSVEMKYDVSLAQNKTIEIIQSDSVKKRHDKKRKTRVKRLHTSSVYHQENSFVDFDRERLLPFMYSNEGPKVTMGDVTGNGIKEIFLPGAKNQFSRILRFESDFNLIDSEQKELLSSSLSEDTEAEFFDADGDGDLDLYVASGGRAFSSASTALLDRLYLNDGSGNLYAKRDAIPFKDFFSTGAVATGDFDQDGDKDIFIGQRFDPFNYGKGGGAYLLVNDGSGKFTDQTNQVAPALKDLGMITDAEWVDVDGDQDLDLVIVGDWESVHVIYNENGSLAKKEELPKTRGWWHTLHIADLNNDDRPDIVAGNHGLNSFFKKGMRMYRADFDKNGTVEQIFCELKNGKYYPVNDRDELIMQIPSLKKTLIYFKDYASKHIEELFSSDILSRAEIFEVDLLETSLFLNTTNGFEKIQLPAEAQYTPIYAIASEDINEDGHLDLIIGGNQYLVKPQFGRFDGLQGLVLYGSQNGFNSDNLEFLTIDGQIRDIEKYELNGKRLFLFFLNDGPVEIYEW